MGTWKFIDVGTENLLITKFVGTQKFGGTHYVGNVKFVGTQKLCR